MKQKLLAGFAAMTLGVTSASAQQGPGNGNGGNNGGQNGQPVSNPQGNTASPVRGIDRRDRRRGEGGEAFAEQSFDGTNNNVDDALMGSIESQLVRAVPADYADGVSAMAGENRPSPRAISNALHAQSASVPNPFGYSDMLWQWGQFLDHDIDLTDGAEPEEHAPIAIPEGDEFFDPDGTGSETMDLNRSIYDADTGTGVDNPRQQINEITAWIDASNVYGSDIERADALRTLDGTGRLKSSDGNLLPFNVDGLPNAGGSGAILFVAGDVRANEQAGLAAMHTLFMREHNRIADRIAETSPQASGEQIYQRARREVIALMQVITFNEFLPALLGPDAIPPYQGYDSSINAGIRNVFSTAAYRLGHTMLSPTLLRLNADGSESEFGHLSLADAFFQPSRLSEEGGIAPILRGLASQVCQNVDVLVVDEVRNFLFGLPGLGGFDLPSLNIQRGRDHGLGSYNDARRAYGLRRVRNFDQMTDDPQIVNRLQEAYGSPRDMDVWSAGLAEEPVNGGLVGELFSAILLDQFLSLRDGDRFWYQRVFDGRQLRRLQRTTLADIIRRNTDIDTEIPDNVFVVSAN